MTGERVGRLAMAPVVPPPETQLPTGLLWIVPLLLVVGYVLVVNQFFHAQAQWTGYRLLGVTLLLLAVTALFSGLWFAAAFVSALVLGDYVPFGVLRLIATLPAIHRHVIVTPPRRPDTAREVWGRFGILLFITLGFEVIFLTMVVRQGDLAPSFAVERPFRFFPAEVLAGLGLALLIAPAGPFLASRVRTRITDSLEFPLLWLAALLLVVGGTSVLVLVVLPGFVFSPGLFFTSILIYAPAAWYVSLAFSVTETRAQQRFVRRAWTARGDRFHFGRLEVTDEPDGSSTEV